VWRRWGQIGTKSGQLVDPGLTSEVRWTLGESMLTRVETLTAAAPLQLRRWRVVVPTTNLTGGYTSDGTQLTGAAPLRVTVNAPWPVARLMQATGDGPLGRGARGPVPLHLIYETQDLAIVPGRPLTWTLTIRTGG
jgi:hypothetical protein